MARVRSIKDVTLSLGGSEMQHVGKDELATDLKSIMSKLHQNVVTEPACSVDGADLDEINEKDFE